MLSTQFARGKKCLQERGDEAETPKLWPAKEENQMLSEDAAPPQQGGKQGECCSPQGLCSETATHATAFSASVTNYSM
jgi:hypothetical protein